MYLKIEVWQLVGHSVDLDSWFFGEMFAEAILELPLVAWTDNADRWRICLFRTTLLSDEQHGISAIREKFVGSDRE
jgi:hypothetical protein